MTTVYLGQEERYYGEECWTFGGSNECGYCGIYLGQTDEYMGEPSWHWGGDLCVTELNPSRMVYGGGGGSRYIGQPRRDYDEIAEYNEKQQLKEKQIREETEIMSIVNAFLMTRH